ncbi:GDSL esterase/lipase [Trifolium pratense]|uniref:GDSL esterase/lipase n=1 Tax=Trifolium pratense TaxID=57577 RepID=A0A2K3NUP9_TRIPR|nr:GDSL esterase/lipase [Trifolium pratense]
MANFLVFTSYIVLTLSLANCFINGVDAARAFFVFGDSLVDNGNNNYLATTARADSPPYGIDFPTREPTGRQEIGTEPILPYLSPNLKGDKLLVGANFASAGVGILNDTGFQFKLYHLGARKVLVTGTGSMGCAPAELALKSVNGECDVELERAAALYNPQLVKMVKGLNKDIGDDVFIAANALKMQDDFITNPELYGSNEYMHPMNLSTILAMDSIGV